ncbi:receptor-like cytosolic serine/threonine-protein kinase RBK2 isoform X3 [Magnolia sinica]|uniref:receptor-like cytosolic serine/threonine-protein kinase RBK2 isoform X3 n=1 Tax=Magnolia sinica TaxID=86752 RepID=UPI00265B6AA2|nr:receptor-like cytosolic serine/threonine-protein kinase RBK2 isoform X3 [Magnolia sinica]
MDCVMIYLAPEYAENGIVSVRTDVYSFGIFLLQLISGRNVINENQEEQSQSLLQWAEVLIEKLSLHELINPCIGESYDTYELYHMARTMYLCVRRRLEMRPSMRDVTD